VCSSGCFLLVLYQTSGAACHPLPGVAEPVHKITMGNIHSLLQDHPLHILLLFTVGDIP
jgi:hypothetical protein